MNTKNLARFLMKEKGWGYEQLAEKCGIKRQSLYESIQRVSRGKKRDGFHLGVIRVAFRSGFEAEALSAVLGYENVLPSLLRAASMYPDLTPEELAKIREAERITHMNSLPSEVIRSIITAHRSEKPKK